MAGSILDGLGDGRPAEKSAGPPHGKVFLGDVDIRIARDGSWHYRGSPIHRKPLVKLFASALKRDADGDFWLDTPTEKCRIRVDDAPFLAVEMIAEGAKNKKVLKFRTNIDDFVIAGPNHPIRVDTDSTTGEPAPYILVRDRLEALIARAVFYDLVEMAENRIVDGETVLGVWSGGAFFPLGPAEDGDRC